MATASKTVGFGATVAFTTSTAVNALKLSNIRWTPGGREFVDVTDYGQAAPGAAVMGNAEFLSAGVYDCGVFEFEYFANPDVVIPTCAASETVTITWPGGGATWVFTGFILGPQSGEIPMKDANKITIHVKVTGGITVTAAA